MNSQRVRIEFEQVSISTEDRGFRGYRLTCLYISMVLTAIFLIELTQAIGN